LFLNRWKILITQRKPHQTKVTKSTFIFCIIDGTFRFGLE
jgi:hypothetical protein